jgi:hypothetical protein
MNGRAENQGRKNENSELPRYTIGSGWWCSDAPDTQVNPKRHRAGDDAVRAVGFFEKWLESIYAVSSPDLIVVVDSKSPTKPPQKLRQQVYWLELPFNARHSTDPLGQWSGWLRSVLLGGQYAVTSEADYFVYVEQDCLLGGEGVIEYCIEHMTRGIMFGSGEKTPQPIQQSFFIVAQKKLPQFLKNLVDLKDRDSDLSPEWKFVFATWRPLVHASNWGLLRSRRARRWVLRLMRRIAFDELPMDGGRTRPIDFSARYFYFQHGSEAELDRYFASRSGPK